MEEVTALTDVTDFNPHGYYQCEGSNVSAIINCKVPVLKDEYIDKKNVPGTPKKLGQLWSNFTIENEKQRHILCDPQTSGGLLIAVKEE
jgi:selenide,water dikinase